MSPYCATMCWVTVIISMAIPALPTHLRGETTGDRWFSQNSVMWSFCVCFVVSLYKMLDKQSSCPWLKTPWRQCHFTALTNCHFLKCCCYHEFLLIQVMTYVDDENKFEWIIFEMSPGFNELRDLSGKALYVQILLILTKAILLNL